MTQQGNTLEAALWRHASDLVVSPLSQSEGLNAVARCVLAQLGASACVVYLFDQRTDELVLSGGAGQTEDVAPTVRLGQGITGLAAYQRSAIQATPAPEDLRQAAAGRDAWTPAELTAVPIHDGDRLLGVLTVHCGKAQHLSRAVLSGLGAAVPRIVVGLMRAAHEQEMLRRRTNDLQALNELGQAMNAGLGLDETLELIAERAAKALGADGAAVRLVVEDGTLALATMNTIEGGSFDSEYEKRVAEYVASTGEPIFIDNTQECQDSARWNSCMVCVPLVLEERVVGTLSLFDKGTALGVRRHLFGLDDLNMLFALSSQIAGEIEDIRMTVRLQELVRTEKQQGEALRGLYGRSQALLQSISDGLLAMDSAGLVEDVNVVAARILGVDPGMARGCPIGDLVEDKPPIDHWLERGGQFINRVVTLRAANGRIAAMANLQPVIDGGRLGGAVLTFREMGEVGRFVNRLLGVQRAFTFDDVIGSSVEIEKTKELARIAAGTGSSILIQGETGTGKEVFAQSIHGASSFSDGPFLAVNCAAIPRDLIESELFGYVEGAFTGASRKGRLGKFELASGGTLFLDEIGDIPLDVQVKLLRVLQEKAVMRVGGDSTIPINCRVIAATNRELHQAVEEHRFRRDLLYRLNVITIDVPPLRDRPGDIPLFVQRFVAVHAERNGKIVDGVSEAAMEALVAYAWPGNVRELENAIEHGVAMVRGRHIDIEDLPAQLQPRRLDSMDDDERGDGGLAAARRRHQVATRQLYAAALEAGGGNVAAAARLLGVSRATLYRRLKAVTSPDRVSDMRESSQL